jgi:hypothetical protein
MPLSIPQIMLGAQVALTHDIEGNRLPVERRGVIVQVDTALKIEKVDGRMKITRTEKNGNPACGVAAIWVRLKKGEAPINCKNAQLTLVHEASRKAFDEIRREDNVKKARELEAKSAATSSLEQIPSSDDDLPIVIPDEPIVVQEMTPEEEGRGLTAEEIRALESGEGVTEEQPKDLKRVMPK